MNCDFCDWSQSNVFGGICICLLENIFHATQHIPTICQIATSLFLVDGMDGSYRNDFCKVINDVSSLYEKKRSP